MNYFRSGFSSFAEFKREGMNVRDRLGKEELELLRALEADDEFMDPDGPSTYTSPWE